jgi:hypothetical protein
MRLVVSIQMAVNAPHHAVSPPNRRIDSRDTVIRPESANAARLIVDLFFAVRCQPRVGQATGAVTRQPPPPLTCLRQTGAHRNNGDGDQKNRCAN